MDVWGKSGGLLIEICAAKVLSTVLTFNAFFRTIAETPSNECSSRSHCIFTIYVTTKAQKTGKIRRSKLNLVDLAGWVLLTVL